ncbi:MAG: hypothetical protein QNI89_16815 [Desulfobacterales bacterium]|nr:hypothetical protein [Desulfobacterales bacterium]MDJ0888970.1 hypothetical protein [Desulfobacterales bacterium]MDJ0988419.1 hypothetical protein [Desulfobacterales bacterium]
MRPKIRYTGINHLAMVTGDMDATIRFWRDLFRIYPGEGQALLAPPPADIALDNEVDSL